jgi:signal transduction histidine kinase
LKVTLPERAREEVSRIQAAAINLVGEVRDLSHELHPGTLKHAGLTAALRTRCGELSNHSGCKVEFEAGEHVDGLGAELSLCLYRVAQEALGNVVRHADARVVRLAVRRVDGDIELTIRDDGRGFDPAKVRALGGLGLISLEERVRILRGKLSIQSESQRGTELRVRVPVEDGDGRGT